MPLTTPTLDQLVFNSATNGAINLDTYLENAELGGNTLAALLAKIFDSNGDPVITALVSWKGDWTAATDYVTGDTFSDPATKSVYTTLVSHTSDTISNDETATNIAKVVDVSNIVPTAEAARDAAQVAQALAETAASNVSFSEVVHLDHTSSPYTATSGDKGKAFSFDTTGGAVTFNLPSIEAVGEPYTVTVQNRTQGNDITVVADGTDTVITSTISAGTVTYSADIDSTPDTWFDIPVGVIGNNSVTPEKVQGAINAQTGTTYTLTASDAYKIITTNNASAIAVTVPAATFAVGDKMDLFNKGAGTVTYQFASGLEVNGITSDGSTTGKFDLAQNAGAGIAQDASGTWIVLGATVV